MSARWIRTPPDRRDEVAAGLASTALGVGVGLVAFYFLRLMLSREPLETARPETRHPERLLEE